MGWVAAGGLTSLKILEHKEFMDLIQGVPGAKCPQEWIWSVKEQWAEFSITSEFICSVKMDCVNWLSAPEPVAMNRLQFLP